MHLQFELNYFAKRSVILEGIERISRVISWTKIIERLYLNQKTEARQDLTDELTKLYKQCLEFLAKSIRFFRDNPICKLLSRPFSRVKTYKIGRWTKTLLSDGSELKEMLSGITQQQEHAERFSNTARDELQKESTQQQSSSQAAALEILDEIKVPVTRMDDYLRFRSQQDMQQEQMALLDWLSDTSYVQRHAEIYGKVKEAGMEGSGRWLTDHPTLRSWERSDASSRLWLHGDAGTGKSTLSAMVTRLFFDYAKVDRDLYPAYYHCSRDVSSVEGQTPRILNALLRQLCSPEMSSKLPEQVLAKYKARATAEGALTASQILELMKEFIRNRSVTVIIVDALDECKPADRSNLIGKLASLLKEGSIVKILLVSRSESDIRKRLQEYLNIEVTATSNKADLDRYVSQGIDTRCDGSPESRTFFPEGVISSDLKEKLKQRLREQAQGRFQWVELQVQYMSDPSKIGNETELRDRIEHLRELPPDLNRIYDEIYQSHMDQLEDLDEPRQNDSVFAQRLFHWMLCYQPPMSVKEFGEIIVAGLDIPEPCPVEALVDFGCGFIKADPELDTLKFDHLSVRDYLTSRQDHLYADAANHEIAAVGCINVLLDGEEGFPHAYSYAKIFWGFHARHAMQGEDRTYLEDALGRFLNGRPAYLNWEDSMRKIEASDMLGNPRLQGNSSPIMLKNILIGGLPKDPDNHLFAAAIWGLSGIVRKIIDEHGGTLSRLYTPSIFFTVFFQHASWHAPGANSPPRTENEAVDLLIRSTSEVDIKDNSIYVTLPRKEIENMAGSAFIYAMMRVCWLATLAEEMAAKKLPSGQLGFSVTDDMIKGMTVHRDSLQDWAAKNHPFPEEDRIMAAYVPMDFAKRAAWPGRFSNSMHNTTLVDGAFLSGDCKLSNTKEYVPSTLPLEKCLRVIDGQLRWIAADEEDIPGVHNFLTSGLQDLKLSPGFDGNIAKLSAKIKSTYGRQVESVVDLDERIANINGHLQYVPPPTSTKTKSTKRLLK